LVVPSNGAQRLLINIYLYVIPKKHAILDPGLGHNNETCLVRK